MALGSAYSEVLIQSYMDLVDIINSTSVDTTPLFSRKNVYPVLIKKSVFYKNVDIPEYGDGSYYGLQPNQSKYLSGDIIRYGESSSLNRKYLVSLEGKNVVDLGSVAINRLFEPSVTYLNGVDFVLLNNQILFRDDPFLNPLIAKRKIINELDNEIDEEIVLWFCDIDIEEYKIYKQYGYIFTNVVTSSEQYKEITKKLFELVSKGPSIFALRSYLSIISGSPVIREAVETIQDISQESDDTKIVITDCNVYTLDKNQELSESIKIGSKVTGGSPLIDVIEIVNTKNKNWWTKFPSLAMPSKLSTSVDTYISFPNKYVKAVYGKNINPVDGYSSSIRFELIGRESTIKNFWESVYKNAKEMKVNYGLELFKKYSGSVDVESDFLSAMEFLINPAKVFAEDFFMGNLLPIRVNIDKIKDQTTFFSTIDPIKDNTPTNVIIMLLLEFNKLEKYTLLPGDGQQSATSINLEDLLTLKTNNFPSLDHRDGDTPEFDKWAKFKDLPEVIEGISIDVNTQHNKKAGRFYKNNFNITDLSSDGFLLEKFNLSSTTNLVQNIEIKQIPKCAIL